MILRALSLSLGLIFFFPVANRLGAQTPAGIIKTQLGFMVVAGAPELKEAYFETTRQRIRVSVTAGGSVKSGPFPYEGPTTLILFVPGKPSPAGQPPTAGVPVARVELPRAGQVFIILGPGKEDAVLGEIYKYTAIAVDDDWTSFPVGTSRILNYSGKRVQATLAGHKAVFDVGPGKPMRTLESGKIESEFNLLLHTMEANGPYEAYNNSLKIRTAQRMTFILVPKSRQGGPGANVVVTREFAPAGTQPAAEPPGRPPGGPRPPGGAPPPPKR